MTVRTRKDDRRRPRGRRIAVIIRNPADDPLHTLRRLLGQQECSRPVSGLASVAASPSHVIRARPCGRHVMSQWLVNPEFTVMQPYWLTVAGAAEALQPSPVAHLVPVSPVSSPKQAPDARGDTKNLSRAVSGPESAISAAGVARSPHQQGRMIRLDREWGNLSCFISFFSIQHQQNQVPNLLLLPVSLNGLGKLDVA
jgi:hypothetical protein